MQENISQSLNFLELELSNLNLENISKNYRKKHREINSWKTRTPDEDTQKSSQLLKLDNARSILEKYLSNPSNNEEEKSSKEKESVNKKSEESKKDNDFDDFSKVKLKIKDCIDESNEFLNSNLSDKFDKARKVLSDLSNELLKMGLGNVFAQDIFKEKIKEQRNFILKQEERFSEKPPSKEKEKMKPDDNSVNNAVLLQVESAIEESDNHLKSNLTDRFMKAQDVLEKIKKSMESDISKKDGSYIVFYQPDIQNKISKQKKLIIQKEEDQFKEFYEIGRKFENASMFKDAIDNYLKYLDKFPDNVQGFVGLSSVYLKQGDIDKSIEFARKPLIKAINLTNEDMSILNYRLSLAYEKKYFENNDLETLYQAIKEVHEAYKLHQIQDYKDKKIELEGYFVSYLDEEYKNKQVRTQTLIINKQFHEARNELNIFVSNLQNSNSKSKELELSYYKARKDSGNSEKNLLSFNDIYEMINNKEKNFIQETYNDFVLQSDKKLIDKDFKGAFNNLNNLEDELKKYSINFQDYCLSNNLENLLSDKKEKSIIYNFEGEKFKAENDLKKGRIAEALEIVNKANEFCYSQLSDKSYDKYIKPSLNEINTKITKSKKKKLEEIIENVFDEINSYLSKNNFDKALKKIHEEEEHIKVFYKEIYENLFQGSFKEKIEEIENKEKVYKINEFYLDRLNFIDHEIKEKIQESKNKEFHLNEIEQLKVELKNIKDITDEILSSILEKLNTKVGDFNKKLDKTLKEESDKEYLILKQKYKNEILSEVNNKADNKKDIFVNDYYNKLEKLSFSLTLSSLTSSNFSNSELEKLPKGILGLAGILDTSIIIKKLDLDQKKATRLSGNINIDKINHKVLASLKETNLDKSFYSRKIFIEPFHDLINSAKLKIKSMVNNSYISTKIMSKYDFLINDSDIKFDYEKIKVNSRTRSISEEYFLLSSEQKLYPKEINKQEAILIHSIDKFSFPYFMGILLVPEQLGDFLNLECFLVFTPLPMTLFQQYIYDTLISSIDEFEKDFEENNKLYGIIYDEYKNDSEIMQETSELKKTHEENLINDFYFNCSQVKNIISDSNIEKRLKILLVNVITPSVQEYVNELIVKNRSDKF